MKVNFDDIEFELLKSNNSLDLKITIFPDYEDDKQITFITLNDNGLNKLNLLINYLLVVKYEMELKYKK